MRAENHVSPALNCSFGGQRKENGSDVDLFFFYFFTDFFYC